MLYRAAVAAGVAMQVIAPGKTSRGPSDRVKTDVESSSGEAVAPRATKRVPPPSRSVLLPRAQSENLHASPGRTLETQAEAKLQQWFARRSGRGSMRRGWGLDVHARSTHAAAIDTSPWRNSIFDTRWRALSSGHGRNYSQIWGQPEAESPVNKRQSVSAGEAGIAPGGRGAGLVGFPHVKPNAPALGRVTGGKRSSRTAAPGDSWFVLS